MISLSFIPIILKSRVVAERISATFKRIRIPDCCGATHTIQTFKTKALLLPAVNSVGH